MNIFPLNESFSLKGQKKGPYLFLSRWNLGFIYTEPLSINNPSHVCVWQIRQAGGGGCIF